MRLTELAPNAFYDAVAGEPTRLQRDNDGSHLFRYNIQPRMVASEDGGEEKQDGWQCRELRLFVEPTCDNIKHAIINSVYNADARLDLVSRYNAYVSAISDDESIAEEYKGFMQFMEDVDELLDCDEKKHTKNKGVPRFVTARQFRLALLAGGVKLADVTKAINALPDAYKEQALVSWEYAPTFERNNPFIAQLASKFGFTDESLDQLFIQADKL